MAVRSQLVGNFSLLQAVLGQPRVGAQNGAVLAGAFAADHDRLPAGRAFAQNLFLPLIFFTIAPKAGCVLRIPISDLN